MSGRCVGESTLGPLPSGTLLFQDERATPAVSALLKEARVGRTISLAPPEEEGEDEEMIKLRRGEEIEREERIFLLSLVCILFVFPLSFPLSLFSWKGEGEGPP